VKAVTRTLVITPSPWFEVEKEVEEVASALVEDSASLERDGYRCVVTKCFDHDYALKQGSHFLETTVDTEAAHILPSALGAYTDQTVIYTLYYVPFSEIDTVLTFKLCK